MAVDAAIRSLGRGFLSRLEHAAGLCSLLFSALRSTGALATAPMRTVLYRQLYFTGIQTFWRASLIGALIGIVILTQVASLVGRNTDLGGRVLVWVIIRELGPLLTAILVISRSSNAVATELASMRINREMDVLRGLGISPLRYLVVPRVVGITISLVALTVWFEAVTIAGGLAFSSLIVQLPFLTQQQSVVGALSVPDLGVSLLKSLLFGLFVAATACYQGLRVGPSVTEIPQVGSRAVMQGLSLVVVVNVLLTVVFS